MRSAHVWEVPLLMEVKRSFRSGDARRKPPSPQQTAAPSSRKAHVWERPLLIATKRSSFGGEARPCPLAPQQTAVPSPRKAHVWNPPLLMATKRSSFGGDDCPDPSSPQQTASPSSRKAHVWNPPLLTGEDCSTGLGVWEGSVGRVVVTDGVGPDVASRAGVLVGAGAAVAVGSVVVTVGVPVGSGWALSQAIMATIRKPNSPPTMPMLQTPIRCLNPIPNVSCHTRDVPMP